MMPNIGYIFEINWPTENQYSPSTPASVDHIQ